MRPQILVLTLSSKIHPLTYSRQIKIISTRSTSSYTISPNFVKAPHIASASHNFQTNFQLFNYTETSHLSPPPTLLSKPNVQIEIFKRRSSQVEQNMKWRRRRRRHVYNSHARVAGQPGREREGGGGVYVPRVNARVCLDY